MEQAFLDVLVNKETVFFGLFMYLFWAQQQEKREQSAFLQKQQEILADLTKSYEKLAQNQEKLTERIEKIEVIVDKRGESAQ